MGKDGAKALKDIHKSGTHVPEKDFSSSKKVAAAASGGKKGSLITAEPYKEPEGYEGSMKDWSDDRRQAQAKGMSSDRWEDSAGDRIADKAGEKNLKAADKPKEASDYKPGVAAFSNSPKSSHGFGHGDGQKQGHLRTSGHSGAHQIGKKRK